MSERRRVSEQESPQQRHQRELAELHTDHANRTEWLGQALRAGGRRDTLPLAPQSEYTGGKVGPVIATSILVTAIGLAGAGVLPDKGGSQPPRIGGDKPTTIPFIPIVSESQDLPPKNRQPVEQKSMYEKADIPEERMWIYSKAQIIKKLEIADPSIGFINFITRFNLHLRLRGQSLSPAAIRDLYLHRNDTFKDAYNAVNGGSDLDPDIDKKNAIVFQEIEAHWEKPAEKESAVSDKKDSQPARGLSGKMLKEYKKASNRLRAALMRLQTA